MLAGAINRLAEQSVLRLETLSDGEVKFRANDGWDINFGDDGANGSLEYGGANIAIASAGNYTITMDLHEAARYKYTIKKN